MRTLGLASFVGALLLGIACGDSTAGSGDTGGCTVGSAGCPCTTGGGCDPNLTCLSNTCVELPGETTTSPTTGLTSDGPGSVSDSVTQSTTDAPTTGPVTSGPTTDSSGGDDTFDTSGDDTGTGDTGKDDGKCGCATTHPASSLGLLLLALGAAVGRRRRQPAA